MPKDSTAPAAAPARACVLVLDAGEAEELREALLLRMDALDKLGATMPAHEWCDRAGRLVRLHRVLAGGR